MLFDKDAALIDCFFFVVSRRIIILPHGIIVKRTKALSIRSEDEAIVNIKAAASKATTATSAGASTSATLAKPRSTLPFARAWSATALYGRSGPSLDWVEVDPYM